MSSSIAGTGKRYTSHLYPPTAFPPSFPYSLADLQASDSQPDSIFYRPSRFVNHIDDHAIKALEEYYGAHLPPTPNPSSTSTSQSTTSNPGAPSARILDLCSSWVSHIPFQTPSKNRQVVGLGMNASELSENPILTAWVVHDLNQTPDFHEALENTSKGKAAPSSSSSSSSAPSTSVSDRTKFDAVICNVSIDYLTRPLEVMKSIWDHLEEGGYAYMAISNRCFPNKVVRPWLQSSTEAQLGLVASYFHFAGTRYASTTSSSLSLSSTYNDEGNVIRAGDLFEAIERIELVPRGQAWDPLWIIRARAKSRALSD